MHQGFQILTLEGIGITYINYIERKKISTSFRLLHTAFLNLHFVIVSYHFHYHGIHLLDVNKQEQLCLLPTYHLYSSKQGGQGLINILKNKDFHRITSHTTWKSTQIIQDISLQGRGEQIASTQI